MPYGIRYTGVIGKEFVFIDENDTVHHHAKQVGRFLNEQVVVRMD